MGSDAAEVLLPIVPDPRLTAIIRQGVAENVFDTPYPDLAARIVVGISLSLADRTTSTSSSQ